MLFSSCYPKQRALSAQVCTAHSRSSKISAGWFLTIVTLHQEVRNRLRYDFCPSYTESLKTETYFSEPSHTDRLWHSLSPPRVLLLPDAINIYFNPTKWVRKTKISLPSEQCIYSDWHTMTHFPVWHPNVLESIDKPGSRPHQVFCPHFL